MYLKESVQAGVPGSVLYAVLAAVRQHVRLPGAILRRAGRIEIDSEPALPVQVDGDAAGHTPVRIELLPLRLPFIVAPTS